MADSAAVDAAQAAGYTVASTTGIVTGDLSPGALSRLIRIVETAGGKLEYTDDGAVSALDVHATTAGGGIHFYAKAGVGDNDTKAVEIVVPVDDNAPHALAVTDDETTVSISLEVDTDGSTILSTVAEVVDAVNTHDDEVLAELLDVSATRESLGVLTFEDIAEANDDLIFTSKIAAGSFSVEIREPRPNTAEASLSSVTVSVENGTQIIIIVPATKTVANVKTAVEALTAADDLVTVTTAGTTTHAVNVSAGMRSGQSSRANRGTALAAVFTSDTLAGGAASAQTLKVVPAVA